MKLKLVKTNVITCASCKQWLCRIPQWLGTDSGIGGCEYCGNTSISVREGRSIGPKSSQWGNLVNEFGELLEIWENEREWFLSTVVTS